LLIYKRGEQKRDQRSAPRQEKSQKPRLSGSNLIVFEGGEPFVTAQKKKESTASSGGRGLGSVAEKRIAGAGKKKKAAVERLCE